MVQLSRRKPPFVLVDCGFQYKEALARLKRLRLDPEDLDGILVTTT